MTLPLSDLALGFTTGYVVGASVLAAIILLSRHYSR